MSLHCLRWLRQETVLKELLTQGFQGLLLFKIPELAIAASGRVFTE